MKRPCLECGAPADKSRCPTHTRTYEATRLSRRAKGRYDSRWIQIRAAAIRAHPWCIDCGTPGTADNPLTGDHIIPLERGGRNVLSNVAVRCRIDNSRKGARVG